MAAVLAVDLGKSGCRAALWTADGAAPVALADGAGAPGLAARGGREAAVVAIAEAVRALAAAGAAPPGDADMLCVGAAGVLGATDGARDLAERLAREIGVPRVAVTSDAVTAHAGALGGAPGAVLVAGTGAVAVGVSAHGGVTRIDGWGPLLGDEGSGGWIGRRGLQAALRGCDGRGPRTSLTAAACAHYRSDTEHLTGIVHGAANPARVMAAFAPVVAAAADGGDEVARALIHEASAALARTLILAADAATDGGPTRVAVVGGLVNLGRILMDPLRSALAAAYLDLREPEGSALDGARLLATHTAGPHEPFVVRHTSRAVAS